MNHFRVFGSDAYAHIPKNERAKFDSKTQKCVMLGHRNVTKGYRLYDLARKRIIHSCDVRFNEVARECSQTTPDVPDNDYQLIAKFPEVPDHDSLSPNDTDYDQQPNPAELRRSTRERKKPNFYGQHM